MSGQQDATYIAITASLHHQQMANAAWTASARVRTDLSLQHLNSAELFSRQSYSIETLPTEEAEGRSSEHFSYTMNSVMSCAFFIEAAINQFFIDMTETRGAWEQNVNPSTAAIAKYLWDSDRKRPVSIEQAGPLEKYDIALALAGQALFQPGAMPRADAQLVIDLRNAFVHAKPEWDAAGKKYTELSARLDSLIQAKKMTRNPLVHPTSKFPHFYLSHGFTEWALRSATNLVLDFYKRLGLSNDYKSRSDA